MASGLKIISVDDEEVNQFLIEELGKEMGYEIQCFSNPIEALDYTKNNNVDIALVDYSMPEMDGVQLIKKIRKYHSDIPIIMITAITGDEELKLNAIKAGATEFLNKPLQQYEFTARLKNLYELRMSQILLKDKAKLLKNEVDIAIEEIAHREIETLEVLSMAAEYKDPETSEHIQRVGHYSKIIASALGESEKSIEIIFHTSPLHDIGKMGIPDSILLKPGKLDDDEWKIMKSHSKIGYNIIMNKKSKYLKAGSVIALSHHEKFNGKGYPNSLKGKDIPLYGRIVAIADVFDALNSKRPYKEPWTFDESADLIKSERGEHFDPEMVDAFFDNIDKIKKIYDKIKDIDNGYRI